MCAMPDDMRWSIVMVITEDLGKVCESNAVGMGHMGHGVARSVRWRGTRHSPAPTRVTVRRRVDAYGGPVRPGSNLRMYRPRVRARRGYVHGGGGGVPDASRTAASTTLARFSSAHSARLTLSRCGLRIPRSRRLATRPVPLGCATAAQRSRGRGHAGPVTR